MAQRDWDKNHMIPKEKAGRAQYQSCDKIESIKQKSNTKFKKLKLPLSKAPLFKSNAGKAPPWMMHLSQSMICANLSSLLTMHPSRFSNAKENKAGHVRVQPTKLLRYTESIEICYTWTKTWEAVISKHSKASWRYYDIIRRKKHISECLAYLTDWYHHMSKQLAKWSLRQRLTRSKELI